MVKKIKMILFLGVFLSCSADLFCAKNKKIALIDMRIIWRDYQGMKDVVDQLKKETLKHQKEIDTERKAVTEMRANYEKKSVVLSDAEKKKKSQEIEAKIEDLRKHIVSVNKELQALDARLRTKVIEDVKKVVARYGKKKKFSLILNKNEAFVLFSEDHMDITDEIMKKLSKDYVA